MPSPVPDRAPGPGLTPGFAPARAPESDADGDFDEVQRGAWVDREVAAGRDPIPPDGSVPGGTHQPRGGREIDPDLLAAICGPDGLGGWARRPFGRDADADVLSPSPVLAALTERRSPT